MSKGYLKIVYGPMFSGKTSEIMKDYKKYSFLKKKILVINWIDDTRYANNSIATHDNTMIESLMCNNLDTIDYKSYDVIIIDEAQFFKNLKKNVLYWCDKIKLTVIVAGLSSDFKSNKMGEIFDLLIFADEVMRLTALCCKCNDGTPGLLSAKINHQETKQESNRESNHDSNHDSNHNSNQNICIQTTDQSITNDIYDIGTSQYSVLCRAHYFNNI